ncbi:MAG: aldehyde dehydrogenase family protein, partial [Planctomycetota bacterium]
MKPSSLTVDAPPLDFGDHWDYAPAPETTKVEIAPRYGPYIDGAFVAGHGKRRIATLNPATEEVLSEVAVADEVDVEQAVAAARRALPKWRRLKPQERAKYLFRIARRIQERARELAVLETLDNGKPIKESRDVDIPEAAKHFFYHAGWADKLDYVFPGRTARPVGVCAQIIPWNFPFLMAAWKIAPALACGNTVVLKPAETTPLTALRLAEILDEVGLPPGVVNILPGDGSTVAGTGRRLTLELGGKSPHLIFDDASLDAAVEGIVQGIFFNQGHVCCAGSRLFVQEGVMSEVLALLEARLATLRVGDPLDKNTDLGAINSAGQLATIQGYLEQGVAEGATLRQAKAKLPKRGYWCAPSWFEGVQPSHVVAREEIFGPVLAVMSFRTPEEALTRANNT